MIDEDSKVKIVVARGVASNKFIRNELQKLCIENDASFFAPPIELCTDNGAMIAYAGCQRLMAQQQEDLAIKVTPRWPLDQLAPI